MNALAMIRRCAQGQKDAMVGECLPQRFAEAVDTAVVDRPSDRGVNDYLPLSWESAS